MLSIPPPCVRQSLQTPPRLRSPHQTSRSPHRLPMDRPPSRKRGSKAGCPARTLFPNRMAPCAVLPTIPFIPRNAARSAMGPCASCMLLALAIVVRVRYGSTASGTGHPLRNHGVKVAVLHPQSSAPKLDEPPHVPLATYPILWGDWERRSHRRELVKLLRHQRVDIRLAQTSPPTQFPPARPLCRAQRAHWRLSWAERLARNAASSASPSVSITLFGIPEIFAEAIGLSTPSYHIRTCVLVCSFLGEDLLSEWVVTLSFPLRPASLALYACYTSFASICCVSRWH